MRARFPLSIVAIIAALTLVGIALLLPAGAAPSSPASPSLAGHDAPQEGCLLVNGYDICDWSSSADLKDVYLRYQTYLGDPISGFDSRSQTFQFGRLTYNPANPDGYQVQFDNLGLELLQVDGRTADPGAEPAPAVRDWLVSIQEVGIDPLVIAGRSLSAPLCDAHTAECQQYFDKQIFTFSQNATRASQVTRLPVGELVSHPQPLAAAPSRQSWPSRTWVLGLAAILAVAGIGLLRRGRQGGLSRAGTI